MLFVRDDVAIASIGYGGEVFAPYIMTLFFFILYCNLLGLLPWGASATGNIAVTAGLALTAFLTIEISGFRALGPKGYLKTIVMVPPGMKGFGAVIMAIIMTPVELIGKIVKPFALTLRLFANMTAGHFVILSLFGIIFLFGYLQGWNWLIGLVTALLVLVLLGLIFVFGTAWWPIRTGVVVGSVVLTCFMMALELLVALLQAYIFALLTSVFIGLMRHEH